MSYGLNSSWGTSSGLYKDSGGDLLRDILHNLVKSSHEFTIDYPNAHNSSSGL